MINLDDDYSEYINFTKENNYKIKDLIYFNAYSSFLNIFVGDDWAEKSLQKDFPFKLGDMVVSDRKSLADKLDIHAFNYYQFKIFKAFKNITEICSKSEDGGPLDLNSAFFYLLQISKYGIKLSVDREIARSKVEHSKSLVKKLREGRDESVQAKRKQLAIALYARRRHEKDNAHASAIALKDEVIVIAKSIGYPLSESRAFQTIYEWFSQYDEVNPRQH